MALPFPACGERSDRVAIRMRRTLKVLGFAEAPPHPTSSLTLDVDLSPQAGRGNAGAMLAVNHM